MAERYVHAVFCDDIRNEVGEKISFMGIYQSQLITASLPISLPKFCISVSISTPIDRPIKSTTVHVIANETKILAEVIAPQDDVNRKAQFDDARTLVARAFIMFAPLQINEQTVLRIRATCDDEVIESGGLLIRTATKEELIGSGLQVPEPEN